MFRLIALSIALICTLPALVLGYDVLVVQDQQSGTYDTILKGFRSGAGLKERRIILQDAADNDIVRIVREDRPSLVLAMGGRAMSEVRRLRQVPIISVFSYSLQQSSLPANLVRISMLPPLQRYVELFRALGIRRIGTVLSPGSAEFAAEAAEALRQSGLRLIVRSAERPEEMASQLDALKGSVDAVWLLPDPVLVNSASIEVVATFSMQQRLPFISFSEAHLRRGAVAAFALDLHSLGNQAATTAKRVIAGDPITPEESYPLKTTLRYNRSILEHFNLPHLPLQRLGGSDPLR